MRVLLVMLVFTLIRVLYAVAGDNTTDTAVWQGDNVEGVAERVLVILLVLPLLLLLLLWCRGDGVEQD